MKNKAKTFQEYRNEGAGYFHAFEYRHLLREGYYQDWKKLKHPVNRKWWDMKYEQIFTAFKKAGLSPDKFSIKHTEIIEKVLKFKKGELIKAYHSSFLD